MQIEVLIKEPRWRIRQVNQVSISFDLYEEIKEAQQKDDQIAKNIERVQRGEIQDFIIVRDLLRKGSRIYIPPDVELKERIMTEAHCTPYTAHPGTTKMYRICDQFFCGKE